VVHSFLNPQQGKSKVVLMDVKRIWISAVRFAGVRLLSTYSRTWNFHARTKKSALGAICDGVTDNATFDHLGRGTSERLMSVCPPRAKVLDLGCGMGRVELWFADHCREIHGVDVSSRMLHLARKRCYGKTNVFFHKGNGIDLSEFQDSDFNFVFSVFVMQHMEREDVLRYLAEISRILVPENGLFYLQFPNLLSPHNLQTFRNYSVREKHRGIARMRYYTPQEIEALLHISGLQLTRFDEEDRDIYALGHSSSKIGNPILT